MSPHLIRQLKRQEGFRAEVYKCPAGKNTIGYGHNIDADPVYNVADFDCGITGPQAEGFLVEDIHLAREELFGRFPEMRTLKPARQDSLINLVFNIGLPSFSGFRRMILAIRHGDFEEAAHQMLDSKWRRDVGPNRSHEVSEQLRTGEYA